MRVPAPIGGQATMIQHGDREFLLSIFLVEAWDSAGALEDALGRLAVPGAALADGLGPSLVLTHRLKGSAALHGFPGVSELATLAESWLERSVSTAPPERTRLRRHLVDVIAVLKQSLDRIGATGEEDHVAIDAFRTRCAASAPSSDAETQTAMPAADAEPPPWGAALRQLDDFFAGAADVMEYFGPEAAEHLDAMTAAAVALDRDARDHGATAALFRAAHTLKGAAYTVGCAPIGDVAHRMEDVLVEVHEGRAPTSPLVLEAIFASVEALRSMVQQPAAPRADALAALARADRALVALVTADPVRDTAHAEPAPVSAALPLGPTPPHRREQAVGVAGPSIRVKLDGLDSMMNLVGELMIARGRLERRLDDLARVSDLLASSRARMTRTIRDFEGKHDSPQLPGARPRDARGEAFGGFGSVADVFAELEFDRYDDFSILARSIGEISADVGEAQAQHAGLLRAIREDMAQVHRLTAALRKQVARARMVPIGRLFTRFARQAREAARTAGKAVVVETAGESVEVDTAVIEQISESLLHVLQNAIVHGIEPESVRLSKGKPAHGTLSLRAAQRGGFIFVEVEDDGGGIDAARLRREAVRQERLTADAARALSTAEALNLVFMPGFSTAAAVTKAAGRGIGLDVVQTNTSRLNGEIAVDTEVGGYTRFTFKLPLTVAIADALMVRAGAETFAIPLTTVGIMRLIDPALIQPVGEREMVELDGQPIELIRLGRVLGLDASLPVGARVPVVVLRAGGLPFAVAVDELCGKEEIVIRSLGEFLDGVGPYAGATIAADGRVILLLDPTHLFQSSRELERPDAVEETVPAPARSRPDDAWSVMLVDDSISVRRYVGQMLERAGIRVVTAVDGQDALDQLNHRSVDLVITDLEMPRVNGYALIEDLRRRQDTRGIPVVVLTTRAGEKHASLARRLGVRHYVAKPVEEQAFVGLVRSALGAGAPEIDLALSGAPVR